MPRFIVSGEVELLHLATMTVEAEDEDAALLAAESLDGLDIDVEGMDVCLADVQGFITHCAEREEN